MRCLCDMGRGTLEKLFNLDLVIRLDEERWMAVWIW